MTEKLLSILIIGKNDNYGASGNGKGGVNKRLELTLNKTIDNLNKLNVDDVEIIVCDWGSEKKIVDELIHLSNKNLKCVYVPPDICTKYSKHFSIAHAYNTIFRKSEGKYTVFWDSDCFIDYTSFVNLYNFVKELDKNNNTQNFFWCSRHHLEREHYINANSFKDIDSLLENNNLGKWEPIDITKNFYGCAMSILFHRSIGEESSFFYEKLPNWGWQDIELHNRLLRKYECGKDLYEYGIKMYHLNHHDVDHRHPNPQINSPNFFANESNWGLSEENLIIDTK